MGSQLHDYGKRVAELISSGQSTSRGQVPLGTFHNDGKNEFVWAHTSDTDHEEGAVLACDAYLHSSVSLVSGMFASATGRWGGVGSKHIRLYSAVAVGSAEKFQDGTFEIPSGTGVGHVFKVNTVTVGAAGARSIIHLDEAVDVAIGTGTYARLRPNKYYGCRMAGKLTQPGLGVLAGACTVSGTTSGYQLLQRLGLGMAIAEGTTVSGVLLGIADSGQLSTAFLASNTTAGINLVPVARGMGGKAGAAGKYFPVEWLIGRNI